RRASDQRRQVPAAAETQRQADKMTDPSRSRLSTVAIIAVTVVCAACDIDLFGNDRRSVVGPYGLFVGEGKYYLVLDKFENGCGILGGSVRQIGWNDRIILVEQETCGGNGARSGWMV